MGSNHRFRLSHLMPNSWFYKLRDMKRPPNPTSQARSHSTRTAKKPPSGYYHESTTPKPLPLSPPQPYTYLQTKRRSLEKLPLSPLHLNPKAINIHFPKDHHHHSPTSPDGDGFEDLGLRPIRTRPTFTGSGDVRAVITNRTCPSSPRLRSRRLHVLDGGRRRSSARGSFEVVKASTDPARDFRESMVEMIVENDMRSPEDLEELVACYLSLNSREYHGVIMQVFDELRLELGDAHGEVYERRD